MEHTSPFQEHLTVIKFIFMFLEVIVDNPNLPSVCCWLLLGGSNIVASSPSPPLLAKLLELLPLLKEFQEKPTSL